MPVVTIERGSDGVARVALNRPDKRNALNGELRSALIEALGGVLSDAAVHAVVLAGEAGHFCAGGDIDGMAGLDAPAGRARMKQNHRIVRLLADAEKPVVAAVEGFAVGAGAGLALLADTIVIAEGGTIGFPFFRVGLIPDYGLLFTLARRVGEARARQLLLYARMVEAKDAVGIGLADELAPKGGAEARAGERAAALAAMPSYAFAAAKRQLWLAPQSLEAALEAEALAQAACFTTADFAEGRAAFRDKRSPDFRR
jgi:2-(1,2-epoxy-1,2-dihydrophenyl)acetyl-CoA isomerase